MQRDMTTAAFAILVINKLLQRDLRQSLGCKGMDTISSTHLQLIRNWTEYFGALDSNWTNRGHQTKPRVEKAIYLSI